MAKRSALIFILSLLLLLAISLWLYTARIASLLIPSLVNNKTLQIDTLHISSMDWKQVSVVHISGYAEIDSGRMYFDIKDAPISYDLNRLQPELVKVKQANINIKDLGRPTVAPPTATPILMFPTEVIVDELHLKIEEPAFQFDGLFQLERSEEGFSALAQNDSFHLEVVGDSTLSNFQAKLVQTDGTQIAQGGVSIENMDLVGVSGTAPLTPLVRSLKNTQLLPVNYQDILDQLNTAVGDIEVSANLVEDNTWQANVNLDASNIVTEQFYGSVMLDGDLRTGPEGWDFMLTRPGALQVHFPSYQLDKISTLDMDLPVDYVISQSTVPQATIALSGNGNAGVTFHRTDNIDLSGNLTAWQFENWERIVVDVQNFKVLSPYSVNAESLNSEIRLSHISPLLMQGDTQVSAVRTDDFPKEIPSFDLRGEWTWNDGAVDINGIVDWGELTTIASWSFVDKGDSGTLHIELDQPVADLFRPAQAFFDSRKQDISFSDGSIEAQLDWTWDKEFYDNKLKLAATGIEGRLLGLYLRNGLVKVDSSDLVTPSLRIASSIPEITLANDVDVNDLSVDGRWQNGFYLDRAALSIFGGTVKMKPVFLGFDGTPSTVELEVNDIELAEILQMTGQEGLTGTGRMDGNIPLRIAADGIAIDDGYLKNKTKGTLSYKLDGDTSPQLDNIALQALQDFRYDALDLKLNYQTNGDYTIRSRLEGRNPQLYDGYPIAFNINLSGSLPGLLRASLVTGDFHSEILKQIQQEQQ